MRGISAWGEMLYLKGETLDEYKARKGATDLDRYMCHTYAFVDPQWRLDRLR